MVGPGNAPVWCPIHGQQVALGCVIECPECRSEKWQDKQEEEDDDGSD